MTPVRDAADIAAPIDQIRREAIKVCGFESSSAPRLVRRIADATGAAAGGALFVEALSPKGGPASTYLDHFKRNVDTVLAG